MNVDLLKGKLKQKGLKVGDLLRILEKNQIKISKTAYFRKINGTSDFARNEIKGIANALDLNDQEILDIFFVEKVS